MTAQTSRQRHFARIASAVAAIALATAALWTVPLATHAATPAPAVAAGTLRVDPPTATVVGGQTFTVNVIQNSTVPTGGSQANIEFDQKLIQVVDVKPGAPYSSALFLFGREADGTNKKLPALIADANAKGALRNLATFLLPGSGTIPPGDAVFVTVTFKALNGPGGTSKLDVAPLDQSPLAMLDETGAAMTVTATGGTVTIPPSEGGATAAPSSPTESGLPTPAATAAASLPAGAAAATLTVTPSAAHVAVAGVVPVDIRLESNVEVASVAADLTFDNKIVQITNLVAGSAWQQAVLLSGTGGGSIDAAIAEANKTGVLPQAGVLLANGVVAPGSNVYLTVTFQGIADGATKLALANAGVTDASGNRVAAASEDADLSIGKGDATGGLPPLLAALPAVLLLSSAVFIARDRRPRAVLARRPATAKDLRAQRWPFVVGLVLGLIPVAMFVGMVWLLIANALPALQKPGLAGLFSDHFSSRYSGASTLQAAYGLLPAIWGTFEIAAIALIVALPISLAMALVSAEFPMGPLGRLLRPLLGVFSGIPPIVYAVAGLGFVSLLMVPKFAANSTFGHFDPATVGVAAGAWPPAGVPAVTLDSYPWDTVGGPNSTLLGGLLIALLVIPFLAPLIYDATQNVPSSVREASFAAGATRIYTLRRVILPMALPGIVAATSLALLKALGDALIVGFAVGWEANKLPGPLFDIFERTPSLAAEGAGLIGNFEAGGNCRAVACPTGYASALLLLAISALVVLGTTYLQGRLRRRTGI